MRYESLCIIRKLGNILLAIDRQLLFVVERFTFLLYFIIIQILFFRNSTWIIPYNWRKEH